MAPIAYASDSKNGLPKDFVTMVDFITVTAMWRSAWMDGVAVGSQRFSISILAHFQEGNELIYSVLRIHE